MPRASFVCAIVVVGGCFIAGRCLAGPQTFSWSGLGLDNNWSTAANWLATETGPINDGTALITFGGRRRLTPTVDLPWSIASVSFGGTADLFTISGSPLTINSGGIVNNSKNLEKMNTPIMLGSGQTWNADRWATLVWRCDRQQQEHAELGWRIQYDDSVYNQ